MKALWMLTVAAAALGGCASEEEKTRDRMEKENVVACKAATRAFEVYMNALRDGKLETAYDVLSWRCRRDIKLETLAADYAAHQEAYHHRAAAKVQRGQYDGHSVILNIVNGDGAREFVSMVPEDGAWKIDGKGLNYLDLVRQRSVAPPAP